ncbi:MAG: hypothetical protein IPL95_16885 [Saprospiraceae bacterium]|nr:hypothetical protein [Saprospiraceae bacterium]
MLAHHPLTRMSYEAQSKSAAFHNILSKIDIALFGHIHVPHHLPTKYRSRTYIFESPQLFDYHLYKLNTNNYHEIGKTLGFNTLTINPNLSKFSRAYYTLKNATESNTEELIKVNPLHFERGNNTPFIWEKTEDGSDSYSLESTKGPIQNIFKLNAKCKGEKNILVDYLKYKSKPSNNRYNYYSKVFDDTDLFVDTDALIGSIYKPESVAHVIDSNVGYLCVQDTKVRLALYL